MHVGLSPCLLVAKGVLDYLSRGDTSVVRGGVVFPLRRITCPTHRHVSVIYIVVVVLVVTRDISMRRYCVGIIGGRRKPKVDLP